MADISFEKSMQQLDDIVKQLEKGDLTLDEMLKLFEQGIALSGSCSKLLDEAEKKVNILIKKENTYEKQEFTSLDKE